MKQFFLNTAAMIFTGLAFSGTAIAMSTEHTAAPCLVYPDGGGVGGRIGADCVSKAENLPTTGPNIVDGIRFDCRVKRETGQILKSYVDSRPLDPTESDWSLKVSSGTVSSSVAIVGALYCAKNAARFKDGSVNFPTNQTSSASICQAWQPPGQSQQ